MRLHDALSGAVLALLAIAVLIGVSKYPTIPGQEIGPAAFPGVVAVLLLGCGGLLIVKGLRGPRIPLVQLGAWVSSPRHLVNCLTVIGGLLFYILCADTLGFIPCSLIILSVLFFGLGVRTMMILPVALVVTLIIHTLFYKFLRVPLPWGLLQGMIW